MVTYDVMFGKKDEEEVSIVVPIICDPASQTNKGPIYIGKIQNKKKPGFFDKNTIYTARKTHNFSGFFLQEKRMHEKQTNVIQVLG